MLKFVSDKNPGGKTIREIIKEEFDTAQGGWESRKRSIQESDLDENKHLRYFGHLALGRTPEMELDCDVTDELAHVAFGQGENWRTYIENRPPRKRYRRHCTSEDLSILNRECRVDGTPWASKNRKEGGV